MLALKLAISNLRVHCLRSVLTVAAVALAVSLVVSVTSGYASLMGAAQKFMDQYLGATDAQVTHRDGNVPDSIVAMLRADPQIRRVAGRIESQTRLLDEHGAVIADRHAQLIGIRRPDDSRVQQLRVEQGQWFEGARGDVAVIDQQLAKKMKLGVGSELTLPGLHGPLKLKVVGVIHKPGALAAHIQTIYAPLETVQHFIAPDQPPSVSRVLIELKPGVEPAEFARQWQEKLTAIDPNLRLRQTRESRKELDRNLIGLHLVSLMGGAVSMAAATFIVFSSLSMGVSERQRVLAMMRAIGALRRQIGALVVVEGLILAATGVLAGVLLGWLWVKLLSLKFPFFFSAGVVIDPAGMVMGSFGSMLAALAASVLPAWTAMRISPLEAMNPLARVAKGSAPWWAAAAGSLLIAIDPLILFVPWERVLAWLHVNRADELARTAKLYLHFGLGWPAVMAGFFLLAPLLIVMMEKLLAPLLAAMLRIQPALLRQQLAGGLWRAAGTCAALMVGLSVLVVTQTQGQSTLKSWRLPDKFPDIFIYSGLAQMRLSDIPKVESVKGIRRNEVMPITLSSPEFGNTIFGLAGAALLPDATMFFGVDPDKAFDLIDLDFRDGNPQQAKELLKRGRYLIVTEELHKLKGLGVGDKLPLKTARHGTVDYTIAGVVWSPGIDVMVGIFDLGRQFEQRTVSSVFGSIQDAQEDFGVDGVYVFAANLDTGVSRLQVLDDVRKTLGTMGLDAGDVRQIKAAIQTAFGNLLLLISTVAFAALAVASLGVTNTIMASIRTRRWQFGILRSIGVTRGQLLRLIVAEALLLGIVACLLGLAAGGVIVIDARKLSAVLVGLVTTVTVPWKMILIGLGVVMGISLLASLWPAATAAREEPLELLQAGRAAA